MHSANRTGASVLNPFHHSSFYSRLDSVIDAKTLKFSHSRDVTTSEQSRETFQS